MSYQNALQDFKEIDLKTLRPAGFWTRDQKRAKAITGKMTGKGPLKNVSCCPVCGSKRRKKEMSKFRIGIFHCSKCSLRYSGKVPKICRDLYSSENYLESITTSYDPTRKYRMIRYGQERLELIRKTTGRLRGLSLLDVGCGTGWFLECARSKGIKVSGQDLGAGVARHVQERLGMKVWNCPVEDIPSKPSYDVITAFDVLEHVTDPVGFIGQLKRRLKRNGILLMFLPHYDSVGVQVMGADSTIVTPLEHVLYVNRSSIEEIVRRSGMRLVYYKTRGMDLGDLMSFYDGKNDAEMSDACRKLWPVLQPVIDAADCGNHVRLILKR